MCEGKEPESFPKELKYYYLCKNFYCLPDDGGLADQDPLLLEAFILIMNVESQHAKVKEAREKAKKDRESKNRKK